MDKNFLIQLTNKIYKLTLLFPKKEPLRYKMRELADDILAEPNEESLKILDTFFEVAKNQNWVTPSDLLAIQKEYDNLREELKKIKPEIKKENLEEFPVGLEVSSQSLLSQPSLSKTISERQEKILTVLKEKGRAQVWEIKQIFPQVTKRTLRRDFEQMLNQGIIERMGEKNNTFYLLRQTVSKVKIDEV